MHEDEDEIHFDEDIVQNAKPNICVLFILIILASFSTILVSSQSIVTSLPGYPGPLPFKLETGYIGVGEDEAVQLFYYFVESEGNPDEDPLIIWLAGGPGCGTLRAFFFEIGPMQLKYGSYMDNVPALQLDPNSWTKVANIIYLDAPTLTGYSYTTTPDAAHSSDTESAAQTAEFMRKEQGLADVLGPVIGPEVEKKEESKSLN
ncbi:serine carboxypeptidase-like 18 [Bidens hawaiensis]|uniref:serine carboxypeptidase-like 18 n=1 Tax=Bidens hawaiensis TaxID=980011 RepID=UPI0040490EA8